MPRRPDLPCAVCGKLMWRRIGISLPAGEATCNRCRRESRVHGDPAMYRDGCRCAECRSGVAAAMRAYAKSYHERTGHQLRDRYPESPRTWISVARRLAIYERDEWACHLCGGLVDRDADLNSDYAPSLDHLTPRVHGGGDEDTNLKCAHRICNAARGARELVV